MIEVKQLDFTYPKSSKKTLNKLDFSIDKGEIFGFLGPSGSGKSTTQKILIGILEGYNGSVKIMGKELKNWNKNIYEKIGVSFELPNMYGKLTGFENLAFVRSFYKGRTEDPKKLLQMVGLYDKANLKASQYSKGMKMRLNFIRSLINNPDIIFLDEPTSGLDPVNAKIIKNIILEKKNEGKTIFLTTHNMTIADELCDRVAFIVDGEIKLINSPKILKVKYGEKKVKVEYTDNDVSEQKDFDLTSLGYNEEFIRLLKSYQINTIHSKDASLEEIFIMLTGRELA